MFFLKISLLDCHQLGTMISRLTLSPMLRHRSVVFIDSPKKSITNSALKFQNFYKRGSFALVLLPGAPLSSLFQKRMKVSECAWTTELWTSLRARTAILSLGSTTFSTSFEERSSFPRLTCIPVITRYVYRLKPSHWQHSEPSMVSMNSLSFLLVFPMPLRRSCLLWTMCSTSTSMFSSLCTWTIS